MSRVISVGALAVAHFVGTVAAMGWAFLHGPQDPLPGSFAERLAPLALPTWWVLSFPLGAAFVNHVPSTMAWILGLLGANSLLVATVVMGAAFAVKSRRVRIRTQENARQ